MLRSLLVLIVLSVTLPAGAQGAFTIVESPHLTLIGDAPQSRMRALAIEFERSRAVVGSIITHAEKPPAKPTIGYVFTTLNGLRPYTFEGFGSIGAGYFLAGPDDNTLVFTTQGDNGLTTARHEYTHLLVDNATRFVPQWLHEGLAEYCKRFTISANGRQAAFGSGDSEALALLRRNPPFVSTLLDGMRASATEQADLAFYRGSWALVHYILSELPNGEAAIARYMTALSEGHKDPEAFTEAFGPTLAAMTEQLAAYVGRTQFAFRNVVLEAPEGITLRVAPLTKAAAAVWLADLKRKRQSPDSAAEILGLAVAQPSNPTAHMMEARLHYGRDATADGDRAMARAAAMAPDDFLTLYERGFWLLRRRQPLTPEQATEALRVLDRAIALKSDVAEAHALRSAALRLLDAPFADVRSALERAATLAPGNPEYAFALTRLREPAAPAAARAAPGAELLATAAGSSTTPRTLRKGEVRIQGTLTQLECGRATLTFHVSSDGRMLVARGVRGSELELTVAGTQPLAIACSARTPPDPIVLTWAPDPGRLATTGIVVAIEFLSASTPR